MGFLGGLIRAGVAGAGGALRGANQGEQVRYEREQDRIARERQVQQDALQKMLLESNLANVTADNERQDEQLRQNARRNSLGEVEARRQAILDAQATARKNSAMPPLYDPNTDPEILRDRTRKKEGLGVYRPDQPKPTPAPKPLPASLRKAVADNEQTLRSIDEAVAAIEKNPDALHGWDTFTPEVVRKFTETPDKVTVRAPVADVGSLQIHNRTGANMNIKEEPRLAPFVPDIRDRPENALIKLRRLKERIQEENTALQGGATVADEDAAVGGSFVGTGTGGDDPATMRMADRFEEIRAANPGMSAAQITQMVKDEFSRKSR